MLDMIRNFLDILILPAILWALVAVYLLAIVYFIIINIIIDRTDKKQKQERAKNGEK